MKIRSPKGWSKEFRACIDCDAVYEGPVKCPQCGGVGEPLDTGSFEVENEYVTTMDDIKELFKNKLPN